MRRADLLLRHCDGFQGPARAGTDCPLDRAMRSFPRFQGIEACLLRLVQRQLERREPIEALQSELRTDAPIAVDAAEITAKPLKLG